MRRRRSQPLRDPGRAVALARVSTDEQIGALTGQWDELRRHARANDFVIEREFEDAGESGRDDDRPGLSAALDYLRTPGCRAGTLLVLHTSRLMRDALKFMLLRKQLDEIGVRIVAAQHSFNDDPVGRLLEQFMAGIAEMESAEIARRTRSGMRSAALRGSFPGSAPPLGYKIETAPDGRRLLVPDELEAPVIRELYSTYARLGAVGTAAELNQRELTTRGTEWNRERVLRVLADTTYIGGFVWGRGGDRPVVIPIEPLVSTDLFEQAQRERERRDPVKGSGRGPASPLLLGNGLVRCGLCTSGFQLQTSGKPSVDGRYEYLQCSRARRSGVSGCPGKPLSVAKLDAAIIDCVLTGMFTKERVRSMLAALTSSDGPLAAAAAQERKRREREVRDLERAQAGLLRAVETQALPLDLIAERLREVRARLREANLALARAEAQGKGDLAPSAEQIERFHEAAMERVRADRNLVRALIRGYIDKIVVEADGGVWLMPKNQHPLPVATVETNSEAKNGNDREQAG